jgi:hypothetical protein
VVSQTVIPSEFVFRILYKMIGFPEQRISYSAQDLNTLLKMLNRTENISISSTEKLIIHQTMPDNTVLEVMAHDIHEKRETTGTNVIPFERPVPREVAIMTEVRDSLARAREKVEPVVEKKLVPLRGKLVVGYEIFAYEARSGDEYE